MINGGGKVAYTMWIRCTKDDSYPEQNGEGRYENLPHFSNSAQFKLFKLFLSRIFHLKFSDHGWLWATETEENETTDNGGLLK